MNLSAERKKKIIDDIIKFFNKEFEIKISIFQAESVLDFIEKEISPTLYNQAINDVDKFIQNKLEDLSGDLKEQ